jgi:hypothetical protein
VVVTLGSVVAVESSALAVLVGSWLLFLKELAA